MSDFKPDDEVYVRMTVRRVIQQSAGYPLLVQLKEGAIYMPIDDVISSSDIDHLRADLAKARELIVRYGLEPML